MNSFAKYLPSKGFLAISGASLLSMSLIGIVFYGSRGEVTSRELVIPTLALVDETAKAIQKELTENDSDNDGLKDWEEALWGSDPNQVDSDGDGTSDGEEVKMGRNPTVASPNDKVILEKTTNSNSAIEEELNTTDKISRIAFSRYLELKQAGGEVDESFQQQLLNEVVQIQTRDIKPARFYSISDLSVVPDNKESATVFASKMGSILKDANVGIDELNLMKEALDKENPAMLKKLDVSIDKYKKIIDDSLQINVPSGLTKDHLTFLNSISNIINTLEAMSVAFNDPAMALAMFGKYPLHFTEMHRAFISIQGYYTRNNITFADTESGFIYARFADIIDNAAQKQTI